MSWSVSLSSRQPYGLARVCQIRRVAQASVYRAFASRSLTGSAGARSDHCRIWCSPPKSVPCSRPARSRVRATKKPGPAISW